MKNTILGIFAFFIFLSAGLIFFYQTHPIKAPVALTKAKNEVMGAKTELNKHIYVDLSAQRLYAYEGNNLVYFFYISSGKWRPTPTGEFKIWIKLRSTRMVGGDKSLGTHYDLPNVPYTMFYYNDHVAKEDGYSLHGAYWHNNFGHPMSHGCINISPTDAEKLFKWANQEDDKDPGTLITIYGISPES